jgi:hypothetical protein
VGAEGARRVAGSGSLTDAVRYLAATAYRHDLRPPASLAQAQRAVAATLLWHLRVLAGWQPRPGAEAIRWLASGFEVANTEAHLRTLSGDTGAQPYRLGALAIAWRRLSRTRSPAELRRVLASSDWGDPGGESPAAVALGMRVNAAVRVAEVPDARRWAAGRLALLIARQSFLTGPRMPRTTERGAAGLLGADCLRAAQPAVSDGFHAFRQRLPETAGWVMAGIGTADELWRAEARWWHELARDGARLLGGARLTATPVVGAVAALSADAWRVRAALELAARGGLPEGQPVEVLDAPD